MAYKGGKNQYSFVKGVGDESYPPLMMQSIDGRIRLDAKYIILQKYSEKYTPKMNFEYIYGQVNPRVIYSNTERNIDISFTLAARNVHEAKANLDYCSKLARSPYGVYRIDDIKRVAGANKFDWAYSSQRTFVINFGTFLRNQTVKVTNFDFSIDIDAGVFDYGSTPIIEQLPGMPGAGEELTGQWSTKTETQPTKRLGNELDERWQSNGRQPAANLQEQDYVYHGQSGAVYPKSVTVTISMLALHRKTLCFGGSDRPEGSLGWSYTGDARFPLDWPHGTGPIAAAPYCQDDAGVVTNSEGTQSPYNESVTGDDVVDEGDMSGQGEVNIPIGPEESPFD